MPLISYRLRCAKIVVTNLSIRRHTPASKIFNDFEIVCFQIFYRKLDIYFDRYSFSINQTLQEAHMQHSYEKPHCYNINKLYKFKISSFICDISQCVTYLTEKRQIFCLLNLYLYYLLAFRNYPK